MYFKKLEIVGFKSFQNKTKLKFEPGVTAVVGPNGCGKSNIVDAIKWVLGEQSPKSMRSSVMGDVIFNGTEKHDPVNVAEVALTLSNEDGLLPVDYDEVTISRKLYRSGESEYLLNKTPVRLTDIRNILMGTGIGTSSYSIVEQGRMDMILSSKPEERRHIFEEASGITRYKAKKREAMLKLEKTKDNLVRITDIVREVERQINAIERKARKAERYKGRYDELKELDVKLSYKKFKELGTNDTSLVEENDKLKNNAGTLSEALKEASENLGRLRREYNGIIEELHAAQSELMRCSSDIDKNKHVIEVNAERGKELEKNVERMDWEIEEATERKRGLSVRLENLQVRLSDTSAQRKEKEEAVNAAEANVKELTEKIERKKLQLKQDRERTVDIVSEQTQAKNALIKLNADMNNARSRVKRLKTEKQKVQTEKENLQEALASIEEKVSLVGRELQDKKDEFRIFNEEYMVRQQSLSGMNRERAEKEKRLNEIRPRREFLERLIAEREGINESVKEILKRVEEGDERFKGVHGILSELINVGEKYQESLESVLGEAAQAIVVDSAEVEKKVTGHLRANSMGSVNFIILDELKKLFETGRAHIEKGMLDDITHVLAAQEPYRSALRVLLRDIYVTVSSDAARMFVDGSDDFYGRIIGEKGEVYRKGMRRSRNFSDKEVVSLFGRKEKAEELKKEEDLIISAIDVIRNAAAELEQWLSEACSKKDILEKALTDKQMEFADVSSKKDSIKEKFSALCEELLILDTDIEEEDEEIGHLQEQNDTFQARLNELDAENAKLQQVIDETHGVLNDATRKREETLMCLSDIKAELYGLRKEEENFKENLERETEFCHRVETGVEEKRARIQESGERMRALAEESKRLEEKNLEYAATIDSRNADIVGKKQRKEWLSMEIQQNEETVKTREQHLEQLRDKTRDIDIMAKELEYKRSALVEKVMDTYKVDISQISMEIEKDADWDSIVAKVEDLKQQLEKMGDVSLGAVEEHKQLEERFRFLTKQRDDLAAARESLLQAITKINRTTRKMFMESFEKIRTEFNDYFRMLFNGGKADLVLDDESNVLECGIDIVVRPPGKKLHNIMQLSGGEKAMTAIALIFAIFKVNPSPFCILDEIDAPLDESNIVRFCRVLQEFLKLSQFVIVTHNRMTIQLADVLYGITMEEKGVSKIVSVKFTEEKEVRDSATVGAGA